MSQLPWGLDHQEILNYQGGQGDPAKKKQYLFKQYINKKHQKDNKILRKPQT